ncbi:MAG: alpha-galactosidase [Kiritimatiellae bacterium]|nr:alpha-galactosidase [Kiritimatiellia bacterium]
MKEQMEVAGVEVDNKIEADIELKQNETVEKIISFDSWNIKLTQVKFMDDTDRHNELTQKNEWLLQRSERDLCLNGNLFIMQESFSRKGKICIKKTALPHARPTKAIDGDLKVKVSDTGWDFFMMGNTNEKMDTWEILEFEGGQIEITKTLHAWQANQRPDTLGHKMPLFLSNTWGDRSRDSCISEVFIKKEIDAAVKLGVDIVQIDDGWQKGVTSNSVFAKEKNGVWEGFWASDPDYWTANLERLPNGLEPIIEYAKEKNIKVGLWFAPDSFDEFANWQKDTDFIIETYEKFGVENFKLDSIKAETETGNQNLQKFFSAVNARSNGQVVFDLDITAGTRPGYFGALQVGPLFVENRYTDRGNYWPHQTLRNLWQLSHWIDPKRLRMEFLNNTRNPNMYEGSPIAPIKYPPATLFATIMFSNPLGWFEISNLPEDYIAQVAPLVKIWKNHREELFANSILPIGNVPDGIEYTGFLSVPSASRSGYILIFREFNADKCYELDLSEFDCEPTSIDVLFGKGCIEMTNGKLNVQVDNKLDFIFAKINR